MEFLSILGSINTGKGGTARACMNRCKVFHNHGMDGNIVTFNFNANYPTIIKKLNNAGHLSPDTLIYNPYIFFQENLSNKSTPRRLEEFLVELEQCFIVDITDTTSRAFDKKTGFYKFFIQRDKKNDKIQQIHEFEDNQLLRKNYFSNGLLTHTSIFNSSRVRISDVIFDRNETPLVTRKFISNNVIGEIHLFQRNLFFKSENDFLSYFLTQLIESIDNKCVLLCDNFKFGTMIANLDVPVPKVMMMHTNHYNNPGKRGAKVSTRYEEIFELQEKFNDFVFLTDSQKYDAIADNLVPSSKCVTIPNFFVESEVLEKVEHKTKIIGFIGRLVKGKGIFEMIDTLLPLLRSNSNVELHIYGTGDMESSIAEKCKKEKINNKVILKGYTENPNEALKTFDIFVSFSESEAYGLTTVEAMNQKVPVVIRDINYGPKDIIEDGVDGFLFPQNVLVDSVPIIKLLINNKDIAKSIGENARSKIQKILDENDLLNRWQSFIEKLY